MQGNVVSGNVVVRSNEVSLEVTKKYVVNSIADALEMEIKEGCLSQRALLEAIQKDLRQAGFKISNNESHFSTIVNNRDHSLYKYLTFAFSIMVNQKLGWTFELMAKQLGYQIFKPEDAK